MTLDASAVLICSQHFPPAVAAGGPARSLDALVTLLHDVEFDVVTSDRDLGSDSPYADPYSSLPPNVHASYLTPRLTTIVRTLLAHRRAIRNQTLYVNSVFNALFTFVPLTLCRLQLIQPARIVLAPRGELMQGAMAIRSRKKRYFLRIFKILFRNIIDATHVTSVEEANDLPSFLRSRQVALAGNLQVPLDIDGRRLVDTPGYALCLARVSPKKNIHTLIKALHGVEPPVRLLVAGSLADTSYVDRCRRSAEDLPERHDVQFIGVVPRANIGRLIADAGVLVHPATGENFGHSIGEALSVGTPVVIGQNTPWSAAVSGQAGWVVDVDSPPDIASALSAAFSSDDPDVMRAGTTAAYEAVYTLQTTLDAYRGLLAQSSTR